MPHLASRREFDWLVGEPAGFTPPAGRFDYLIDLATPSAAEVGAGGAASIDHCLQGTTKLIDFARASGVRRILYASSGAVYGRQPPDLSHVPEDFVADPATVSPYGRLKQHTERRFLDSERDCVVARGFAFIGPYLPLTSKFAAGSFIRDALDGRSLAIEGDGRTVRSYLYAADLSIWLLSLLLLGKPGRAYNVGSDQALTIGELAQRVTCRAPAAAGIETRQPPGVGLAERYVPDIRRARDEAALSSWIGADAAIDRTLKWHRPSLAH